MFVKIPVGVSIRKLKESRRANKQPYNYNYTAFTKDHRVYGDTLREVIAKIKELL